ncbi:MAG: tRNA 5-methylaminomethyl-2-thiouridine biosynthesis bifunctional protein MnmC [Chlamydiales bacterium]|nr:tRNA 5-methylaminomethyl-2-thiouridine biosynthesis bifunctional protein MnmC [Chlamydiales bacterium]MCH9636020.1 tRNA 5-methylaminomethyl-2-thiouridine biosynthesis bifunctional protein MnmC [Chlamydiales bacterium]MCH9703946.1 FAD-binding oxidoreductase [Chlamydiota bacterium]
MKIAVLGAGFAGLAVTYHLTRYCTGRWAIDLYDPEAIGQGPSGISLGLLHPYMGRKAMRSWRADSCLEHAHNLITVASKAINEPIVLSKGVVRPASSEEQCSLFEERAKEGDHLQFWDKKKSEEQIHGLNCPGSLFVKEGWTLNVKTYLDGLFRACLTHGVIFKQLTGLSPEQIERYDAIVVCLGANALGFGDFKYLPMTPIKGQILQLSWPQGLPPLPNSLVGPKQIVMAPDGKSCFVGSTYEHKFEDFIPHPDQAWEMIMPQVLPHFPALEKAEILHCRSGFRASPINRFPLAGKQGKFYFLTGFGSRGLLYHGWLGRRMAQAIVGKDLKTIPPEVLHTLQIPQQS